MDDPIIQLPLPFDGKICYRCHLWKPLADFVADKRLKDGKSTECKICKRRRTRELYLRTPEYQQQRHAAYRATHKEQQHEYQKQYFQRNKARILKRTGTYQKAHREQSRLYSRRYYQKNPEYFAQWQRDHPEQRRAAHKRWYYAHPDKVREGQKQQRAKNPDYHKNRYQLNRDQLLNLSRQWYEANRERKQAKSKEWRKNNPLKVHELWQRRRARIRAARVGKVDLKAVYERDKGICHICKQPVPDGELSFDHVIPLAKGGAHSNDNLAVAHLLCNIRKGTKILQPQDMK